MLLALFIFTFTVLIGGAVCLYTFVGKLNIKIGTLVKQHAVECDVVSELMIKQNLLEKAISNNLQFAKTNFSRLQEMKHQLNAIQVSQQQNLDDRKLLNERIERLLDECAICFSQIKLQNDTLFNEDNNIVAEDDEFLADSQTFFEMLDETFLQEYVPTLQAAQQTYLTDLLERIGERKKMLNFERIGYTSPIEDDLTQINGVNTFTCQKLFKVGINSFQQIARLNIHDQIVLNDILELPENTIINRNWVQQSRNLLVV
ncbi:MAG: hypothetical protein KA974_07025 [Saprospiraceae bacterium]|nr:hypothetical protein [Saprospiraceae bacterium]